MSSEKKRALITGASRGIGRAVAFRLAKDGFHCIVNYHSNTEEAAKTVQCIIDAGGSAETAQFDVADRISTLAAIEELLKKGAIDVLVFNAGIRRDQLFVFMTDDEWDSVMKTDLDSFYAVVKPVVRAMLLKRNGRIVVVTSVSGEMGMAGQVNYAAAKAGLVGAVKSLALECAKRDILVNAVSPGFIETEMTARIDRIRAVESIPMNRFGKPEEVAVAVSFLCSPETGYITGQVLGVNGGISR